MRLLKVIVLLAGYASEGMFRQVDVSPAGCAVSVARCVRSAAASVLAGLAPASRWEQSLPARRDGTVWALGYDGFGQLIDGAMTQPSSRVAVSELVGTAAAELARPLIARRDSQPHNPGSHGASGEAAGVAPRHIPLFAGSRLSSLPAIASRTAQSLAERLDGMTRTRGQLLHGFYGRTNPSGDGSAWRRSISVEILTGAPGDGVRTLEQATA